MKNTVKLHCDNKPKMVAHRGVSKLERENTHAAFIAAGNRSYYGIETDIYRTIDGQYVCIHDSSTLRVAMDDINVTQCTYDTVRRIKLCGMSGEKDRNDICIPSLREYIRICKEYGKVAVLELKQDFPIEQLEEIISIIRDEEWLEHTTFIAFCLDNLIRLRERYPGQSAQYLIGNSYFERGGTEEILLKTLAEYNLDLDIYYKALTPSLSENLHAAGKKINVWTVDTVEEALPLVHQMNVDMITSNILE